MRYFLLPLFRHYGINQRPPSLRSLFSRRRLRRDTPAPLAAFAMLFCLRHVDMLPPGCCWRLSFHAAFLLSGAALAMALLFRCRLL